MNLCTRYHNARSAAYKLKEEMQAEGITQGTARPWNMHDPENTFWWLVPSSDWPAYKHGKLFFAPKPRAPKGCLFCGLHIEKGLHPSIEAAYPSAGGKRLIMREDWAWHQFHHDLHSEKVRTVIHQASERTGQPILFRFEAGYVPDPGSFDPQAPRPQWDNVVFETTGTTLDSSTHETSSQILNHFTECGNLEDIATAISRIENVDWCWIDIFIGTVFELSTSPADSSSAEDSLTWKTALSVWTPWLNEPSFGVRTYEANTGGSC